MLANGDELNLNLSKCARPLYFFISSGFLALLLIYLKENSRYFCVLVCNFFTTKCNWSSWENLDRGQYRFQPIKFVNSVVPSLCGKSPYTVCRNIESKRHPAQKNNGCRNKTMILKTWRFVGFNFNTSLEVTVKLKYI